MHLCFVVEGYPISEDPYMPFIRELAAEMVKQGVKCSVIAPQSVTRAIFHKLPLREKKWTDNIDYDKSIDIYQPYIFSFSKFIPKMKWINMIHAVKKVYKKEKIPADVLYAHFWHMGVVASKLNSELPIVVACGESCIEVMNDFSKKDIDKMLSELKGVVYVGSKSLEEARNIGLQKEQPYIIAPNGYDETKFFKMEQATCRKKLGWPFEAYIVSFVGSFNQRKGTNRLADAIQKTEGEIYSCFIGSGDTIPECDNILFCGKVSHSEIALYLNASDVFVLPTNNEGCCNAIVEALACGLPVISSNQSFNDDILDESCSIRIDPMNIDELSDALLQMSSKDIRLQFGRYAISKSRELTIRQRTYNIICFIHELLK